MIIVTILVIISFIAFYNGTRNSGRGGGGGAEKVATVYNHSVTLPEFERSARKYYIARQLGLADIVQLLGFGSTQNEQIQNYFFNQLVLQHEASLLQINPAADEVQANEKRIFQTNGEFDSQKLTAFIEQGLAPMGFNGSVIDDLVTDSLQLRKLMSLIGSSVDVSPTELRSACNQYFRKTQIAVIRYGVADMLPNIQVENEDVKKTYEQGKEGFKSEEKRKIEFVTFALSDEEKTLKDASRIDALQKLANKANDFIQTASAKDAKFGEVAAQFKIPVTETAEFTQDAPDAKIEKLPGVTATAFKVTQDNPTEAVQVDNTFYIVHLVSIEPSRQLTLEEAKPKIVERIKTGRAREALSLTASISRGTIEQAMKSGKSPLDAAKEQKLKVDEIPPFSIAEFPRDATQEIQQLASKSIEMKEGQLSEFIPTPDGGCILYVEKLIPLDDAKFAEVKEKFLVDYLGKKRLFLFLEWLRLRRDAAKIQFAQAPR